MPCGVRSAREQRATPRPRWLALAASVVAGVLIGSVLWIGHPRDSLATRRRRAHARRARLARRHAGTRRSGAASVKVLAASGLRLRGDPGHVSYATSCPFRGATVPHLVVQTADGPVTVLVLRHDRGSRAPAVSRARLRGYHRAVRPGQHRGDRRDRRGNRRRGREAQDRDRVGRRLTAPAGPASRRSFDCSSFCRMVAPAVRGPTPA